MEAARLFLTNQPPGMPSDYPAKMIVDAGFLGTSPLRYSAA